jgi:tRNA-Thr(GGU) m(6)t(6)A37 methyltransferase TsaA
MDGTVMRLDEDKGITIRPIARIHTDFPSKFGIPRQPGIVGSLQGKVVFEEEYRSDESLRGLDGFSHIWLIWGFSASGGGHWSPTVRPPRLGGNERVGVFASPSPFRPNPLGLSVVMLEGIVREPGRGMVLIVRGADMMDGTPIYDIKPYIGYSDRVENPVSGYASEPAGSRVGVEIPPELLARVPEDKREALLGVLSQDPRPAYQDDPERIYGFGFAGMDIRFRVEDGTLYVCDIRRGDTI